MKKFNLPLILGGIIIFLVIVVMVFPSFFTKVNPYGIQQIKTWTEEVGKFKLQAAPFPPSRDAILGTDELGRDTLSLIIYGTKLTISLGLLVVIGRFLIALPIGMTAGFGSLISKAVINQFNVIFSAIPALLISLIVLKLDFFVNLDKHQSIVAFVIVLSFVGWAKLGLIIMERVQEILAKPFIKDEIAIGKSRFKIAIENVIPHLAAEIVVIFFMEIARALTLIMQLGIFGVFVGNLRIIEDTEGGKILAKNISFEPEWASMLGTARNQIRSAPWNVFSPACAFFISVLGFNLFGEGLRGYLQKKDSKFIPTLRRILSFDFKVLKSPFQSDGGKRSINYKVITVFLVILIAATGIFYAKANKYEFCLNNSTYNFTSSLENQVVIGSDEAEKVALDIAMKMKEIGLEPLYDEGFIKEYKTVDIYVPTWESFEMKVGNEKRKLILGKDYSLIGFGDIDRAGKIYDATRDDMFNIKDYNRFSDKFVLINTRFYTEDAVKYFANNILEKSSAKGVLCIAKEKQELPTSLGHDIYGGIVAVITKDMGKVLIDNKDVNLNISVKSNKLNSVGRNVLGILRGEDQRVGEEAIIVGLGYNYTDKELGEKRLQFDLELMKRLSQDNINRNRSIIFAFWDGTIKDEYDGIRDYVENPIYPVKKSTVYIDLSKLNSYKYDYLNYSTAQAPLTRYFGWSLGHQLEKNCEEKEIEIKEYGVKNYYQTKLQGSLVDNLMFLERGIATIIIRTTDEDNEGRFDLEDIGRILIRTINENNY
ncbi:MAG: ABC transporter permease subunit [Maledivibacter sp.]|jgi:peptide/nickel transport system permease protein|nr:ABC transporter permease subunit [Maledivibacter sp.]